MAKIFFSDIQSVSLNYHTPSHIEKYISKTIVLRIWSFHFVHHFPFVPRAKSDRKLSFVARYFITFIFPRKLIFFHFVASTARENI